MASYDDDLRLAHVICDQVDALTTSRFKALDLAVETKPDLTPVTDADRSAEELVRTQLRRTRPRDAVVGEEYEDTGHGPRQWVVDPIDGTKSFVRGVPVWATLLALLDAGRPVLGVVSAPALNRRWWAATGSGAWTGRSLSSATRLHVSSVSRMQDAVAVLLQPARLGGARAAGRLPRPHPQLLAHPRLRRLLVLRAAGGGRRRRGRGARARAARHGRPGADRHRGRRPVHRRSTAWTVPSAATRWPPTATCTTPRSRPWRGRTRRRREGRRPGPLRGSGRAAAGGRAGPGARPAAGAGAGGGDLGQPQRLGVPGGLARVRPDRRAAHPGPPGAGVRPRGDRRGRRRGGHRGSGPGTRSTATTST